jgi:putative heme transporter
MTDPANSVPPWLRNASALSWRLLVVGAAVFFTWQVLQRISLVVLSVVIALFPAALLWKPVRALKRRGWWPLLATWTVLIASTLVLVGIGFLVLPTLADGLEPIVADVNQAFQDLQTWLVDGPLGLTQQQIDDFLAQIGDWAASLGPGLLSGAVVVVEVITGLFLTLIVVFFILKDGDRAVARLLDRLSPVSADRVARGGRVAWTTMGTYVKGLALVGLVDATAIAIGLLLVGVPLVLPLAILVFLGAFFPLVGAFISGLFAVAVALVNGGPTDALIVLAIIIAVQQLEGDVILPVVFGRTMQLHPLVILLAITIGGVAFGLIGAFLAVPVAAVIVAVNKELSPDPDSTLISLVETIE